MNKFVRYWLPLILYVLAILLVSLWLRGPNLLVKHIGDKPLHAMEYGLLAVLALRALGHGLGLKMVWSVGGTILLVAAVGGIDELVQGLNPSRSPDLLDLTADLLGGVAGVVAYLALKQLLARSARPTT